MRLLRSIVSIIYSGGVLLRNWMYDTGIKRTRKFKIPVVCVGNVTVGGTGKTPVVEFIAEELGKHYTIAILSRGYKRRTKGFLEVQYNSSYLDVGDEPKQMKRKFPNVTVVVCEDRCEGVRQIRKAHPEVDLILMDDGFQHRRLTPKVSIVLMDFTRPVYHDNMLPLGTLRDNPSQMHRAGIIIVTKTPENISPIDKRIVVKELDLFPYQKIFFTSMRQGDPIPIFPEMAVQEPVTRNAALLCGIGNPKAMEESVRGKYNLLHSFTYPDHYRYKVGDLHRIVNKMEELPEDTIILTTEKDAVKLTNRKKIPVELQRKLYYIPLKLHFFEDNKGAFLKTLYKDVNDKED